MAAPAAEAAPVQNVSPSELDGLAGCLLLFVAEGAVPLPGLLGWVDWRLSGALSRHLAAGRLETGLGALTLVPGQWPLAVDRIFLCGLGKPAQLRDAQLGGLLGGTLTAIQGAGGAEVAMALPALAPGTPRREGLALECMFARAAARLPVALGVKKVVRAAV